MPAAEQVVSDVEDVVGVLIGASTLQNIQPGIEQLLQADTAHHAVDGAETAAAHGGCALGELVRGLRPMKLGYPVLPRLSAADQRREPPQNLLLPSLQLTS